MACLFRYNSRHGYSAPDSNTNEAASTKFMQNNRQNKKPMFWIVCSTLIVIWYNTQLPFEIVRKLFVHFHIGVGSYSPFASASSIVCASQFVFLRWGPTLLRYAPQISKLYGERKFPLSFMCGCDRFVFLVLIDMNGFHLVRSCVLVAAHNW